MSSNEFHGDLPASRSRVFRHPSAVCMRCQALSAGGPLHIWHVMACSCLQFMAVSETIGWFVIMCHAERLFYGLCWSIFRHPNRAVSVVWSFHIHLSSPTSSYHPDMLGNPIVKREHLDRKPLIFPWTWMFPITCPFNHSIEWSKIPIETCRSAGDWSDLQEAWHQV